MNSHPDVFMPPGEPQYFARGASYPIADYVGLLASRVTNLSRQPVVGEKSPESVIMSDLEIAFCAALFPDLRLVCLVREPVARAHSHFKHIKTTRPDSATTLDQLIRCGRYRANLMRWATWFPPDQMLLVDFDRIASEPDALIEEILAHIGASIRHPALKDVRISRDLPPPELAGLLEAEYRDEPHGLDELRQAMARAWAVSADALDGRPRAGLGLGLLIAAWSGVACASPGDLAARERLAELLQAAGRTAEAVAEQRALAEAQPWRLSRWLRMVQALETDPELADEDLELQTWSHVFSLGGEDYAHRNRLAQLLDARGRHAEAAQHLRVLAEAHPHSSVGWRRVAERLRRTGDMEGELEALRRAAEAAPSDTKLRGAIARLLRRLGRDGEADAEIEAVRALRQAG